MKAIFIDATHQAVSTVDIDENQALTEYYRLLDCHCVTVVTINDVYPHSLYLDDEALVTDEKQDAFIIFGQRFIGNGVIVGFNEDEGDDTDTRLTENYVRGLVTFCKRQEEDQPHIEFYTFEDLQEIRAAKLN